LQFYIQYLNKTLKNNFTDKFKSSGAKSKIIDNVKDHNTRVKIILYHEIIINIFYSELLDYYVVNIMCVRIIESLCLLFKNRRIKNEIITKRYLDIIYLLHDTISNIDPRIRILNNDIIPLKEIFFVILL